MTRIQSQRVLDCAAHIAMCYESQTFSPCELAVVRFMALMWLCQGVRHVRNCGHPSDEMGHHLMDDHGLHA